MQRSRSVDVAAGPAPRARGLERGQGVEVRRCQQGFDGFSVAACRVAPVGEKQRAAQSRAHRPFRAPSCGHALGGDRFGQSGAEHCVARCRHPLQRAHGGIGDGQVMRGPPFANVVQGHRSFLVGSFRPLVDDQQVNSAFGLTDQLLPEDVCDPGAVQLLPQPAQTSLVAVDPDHERRWSHTVGAVDHKRQQQPVPCPPCSGSVSAPRLFCSALESLHVDARHVRGFTAKQLELVRRHGHPVGLGPDHLAKEAAGDRFSVAPV